MRRMLAQRQQVHACRQQCESGLLLRRFASWQIT